MGVRQIVEDFEARLAPVGAHSFFRKPGGKVERERFANGEETLHARLNRLDVPDGATVQIFLDGNLLGAAHVEEGRTRFSLTNRKGTAVPVVAEGNTVEIRFKGEPLLRGVFRPD